MYSGQGTKPDHSSSGLKKNDHKVLKTASDCHDISMSRGDHVAEPSALSTYAEVYNPNNKITSQCRILTFSAVWMKITKVLETCSRRNSSKPLRLCTQRMLITGVSPDEIYASVLGELARSYVNPREFAIDYQLKAKVR